LEISGYDEKNQKQLEDSPSVSIGYFGLGRRRICIP